MTVINFSIEVSGCPTTCLHCWARGHRYKPMPITDIAWVLEEVKDYCDHAGIACTFYPMHEVLHHPQAAEVLELFTNHSSVTPFEMITTDGVSLARRNDWAHVLETAQACGTKTLWFAVHGKDEVHDEIVNYPGAYQDIVRLVTLAKAMGFRCGSNILISRACLPQIQAFLDALQTIGFDELGCEIASYNAHRRGRYYHKKYRPTLDEVLPYAGDIQQLSDWWKEEWNSLPERTEAAWYRKVMEGELDSNEWVFPPRNLISMVIRPDMSIYRGKAGIYGASYGNLRSSSVEAVVKMAIADGETTDEGPIYFSVAEVPKPVEAARVGGDPDSQKVHLFPGDAYTKWLDVALAAYRRY